MPRRSFFQLIGSLIGMALAPRRQPTEPPPTLYSDGVGTIITTELSDNDPATGISYDA